MDINHFSRKLKPLIKWYLKNDRPLAWRVLWKKTGDPYVIWISEIMLQQTTIKVVEPKYQSFMDQFPNLTTLALASEESIRSVVRGLGYYRRFKLMHQCAQVLSSKCQDSKKQYAWPTSAKDLIALPGIGPYTAAAIASIAFGEKVSVLDGNVERVLCRLFGLEINPKEPLQKKLLSRLAQQFLEDGYDPKTEKELGINLPGTHNQAMMELGQLICTPQSPLCNQCPLKDHCRSFINNSQDKIPLLAKRKKPETIDMLIHIVGRKNGRKLEIALFERSDDAKFLKGTRGFLSYWKLRSKSSSHSENGSENFRIGSLRHSITHHQIHAQIKGIYNEKTPIAVPRGWELDSNSQDAVWIDYENIESCLVSNLDRKAWLIFQKSTASATLN